jgi:hypothetical protein
LFRNIPAKEIQELSNYRTKFYRRNITALYFLGHFCKYQQASQNYYKELNCNEK